MFPAAQAPKVNISLYYESLCPYSMAFIMGQASKAYNKVGSIMNLEMIPFGNAVVSSTQIFVLKIYFSPFYNLHHESKKGIRVNLQVTLKNIAEYES